MRCALLLASALMLASPAQKVRYELRGRLKPATRASVWLHGAVTPFDDGTLAGGDGQFRFRDLLAGTYTLGAFVPGRGELRRTIEIGPSVADARRRIDIVIDLGGAQFESRDSLKRGALVSAKELAIPDRARREYDEAAKRIGKRDVDGAVAHLKRAVAIAPRFATAWNYLGTIAYQTQRYAEAEGYFRKAVEADPEAYEPLVNLGGVLVNLQRFGEALQYNRHAVLTRPGDALANSQLGMTYFYLGNLELSRKYLEVATQIDPGHFSHPQLMLAEIAARQGDRATAAAELEEFLKYHPDWAGRDKVREDIARLRQPAALSPQSAAPVRDPAGEYSASGMARSFSDSVALPPLEDFFDPASARRCTLVRKQGGYFLESRGSAGGRQENRVDALLGSGRHFRVLLSRGPSGQWAGLPVAWYTEGAGHWGPGPVFAEATCLPCHTSRTAGHTAAIGCQNCHSVAKPDQAVCLGCHLASSGPAAAHGPVSRSDDSVALNSAAFRLFQSRCYKDAGNKLACTACHPPHAFSKTVAEYRQVCRGCHPTMHNSAPLECTRCHMPKRPAGDVAGVTVTDHKIQRPL